MANDHLVGDAEIRWPGDGTEEEVHLLRVPLQQVRAAGRINRTVSESIDLSTRNVIVLSSVHEIIGVIRYDDDPIGLVDLLAAGMSGHVLTYDDGANSYDCYLIEPSDEAFDVGMEQDYNIFQEGTIEIRLRRTNGQPFEGLFGEEET